MRLFFRRRKLWAVLCISITTISVLWTYRVRSWPKQDGRVRHESVHPVRTSLTRENINSVDYDSRTSVRGINGEFGLKKATQKGITRKPLYPVTRTTKVTRGSPIQRGLLQRLQEVETKMSKSKLHKESKVLHVSSLNVVQENALVYKQAFVALGYNVVFSNLDVAKLSMLKETDWQGVLCFTTGTSRNISSRCPMRYFSLLQEHTKVSPIPGLEKLLLRNDGFCYIMSASHHLAALENKPLSPPCFVLPAQLKLFSKERQEKRTQWTLKTHRSETTPMDTWGAIGISAWKIKDDSEDMVVQQLPENVLLIGGEPVVVQVYVLVTSASPIRVYRHSEGHAFFPRKGDKSNWSLEMFIKHLESHYGEDRAGAAIQQMDDLIVTLFLVLEPSLITFFKGLEVEHPSFRTQNFFYLLQISFMFNSSLYPYILEVKDPKDNSIPQKIVQDTVNMVFNLSTKLNISHEAHKTLEVLLSGVKEPKCRKEVHQCITDDLLHYLLETRREADHLGNYNRLYPTHNGSKFNKLVTYLSKAGTGVEEHVGLIFGLGTPDLHNVLTAFERRFNLNMNVAMQDHKEGETTAAKPRDIRVLEGAVEVTGCDSDPEADPVLIKLDTYPTITLHPPFKSDVFIYQATVPFDTMVLQIRGRASTCKSGVRVNSRNEDSLSSNHSLGVGWNKFAIFVDDTSQSTPEAVYTYSLYVFRQRRSEKESPFFKESNHQVCAQLQECDLKVFPNKSCGLNKLPAVSWNVFLFRQEQLPRCETGHESGRWVLPCASCDDPKSCYWKEAVWAPYSCQYRVLSRDETRTCLAKKKILFVGDSTNRGMMYYLMEKLNGSLSKWEKTHAMKIYSDELNGSRTSVSFAYYPQFWLSENMRPVFVKALYQLIARFLPLENSTNTILVVGGVQWIWPHHITETKKALTSLGLNGIKVIIKSLGAGFHLPVPGLLRQDLAGQRRTAERNQRVIKAAKQLGYDVVDTFGMTVSRYKDFLQGKCGCHFHKVVDMRSLMKEADEVPSPLLEDGGEKNSDFLPRYHVIGPINSVYSELVINRMCS